jgi:ribonucleotide monophosphatase NagD (HAD superfamily)
MIDNIMRNTYGVLTNRCSIEDILEQYEGKDAMFYGNPYDITIDDIYEVISYFEDTEEYEKCMELVYVQNDIRVNKLIRECL